MLPARQNGIWLRRWASRYGSAARECTLRPQARGAASPWLHAPETSDHVQPVPCSADIPGSSFLSAPVKSHRYSSAAHPKDTNVPLRKDLLQEALSFSD